MQLSFLFSLFSLQTVSFAADSISPFLNLSDGRTIVSKGGSFELGLFSPGTSTNLYVGIWYKKIPVRTVVWVANRCNPISDSSGLLTINSTGNLVLLNQNKSIVVWSTNSSKQAKKPIVELLDSGNLVLRDEEDRNLENYLWQSFDYPSDALLPGMKLGWDLRTGLNRRLSAWKSWDDPCPGDLSLGFEVKLDICPEACMQKGTATYFRSGPWDGIGFRGSPEVRSNQPYDRHFVYNGNELYYTYNLKNNSVITIMVLNQTSSLFERLVWTEGYQSWRPYASVPKDDCDRYGHCGPNGNCVIGEAVGCNCLKGFKPMSPQKWDLRDWTEGCIRENPLNCNKEKHKDQDDGFVKLVGVKMPDSRNSWFNDSMNLKECRVKCLSNCSCSAYSNRDIRGDRKGCRIWFDDLMDIRQISGGKQELYV